MLTRRTFVKQAAAGAAAYAAYSLSPAGRVLGANDRVRFGLIGAGAAARDLPGRAGMPERGSRRGG